MTTAEFRNAEDYSSFAEQVQCADEYNPALGASNSAHSLAAASWSTTGFRRVQRDGGYIYQSVFTLVGRITDDQVYDPDETFRIALQRGPNMPNYVTLITTSVLYPKYAGKSGPRWPGFRQRSWSIRRAWGLRW